MAPETILGVVPLFGAFCLLYVWSDSVVFKLIPRLFDTPAIEIDHRKLGLKHAYEDLSKPSTGYTHGVAWTRVVRVLFAFTLSCNALVIVLVLLEILQLMNHDSKVFAWHAVVPTLIVLLTYVIPAAFFASWIRKISLNAKIQAVITAVGLLAWTTVLGTLRGAFATEDIESTDDTYVSRSLRQLTLLGVVALAFLSGMGSISQPFYCFLRRAKPVKETDIANMAATLRTTDELLSRRQHDLELAEAAAPDVTQSSSFRDKLFRAGAGSSSQTDLRNEVNALIQMERAIYLDLGRLTTAHEAQLRGSRIAGKFASGGRRVFAVYCCYKVISILCLRLPVILYHEYISPEKVLEGPIPANQVSQDALAVTLAKLVKSWNQGLDEDSLVIELSFILSGALFYCSFSSVLLTFNSLKKLLPVKIRPARSAPENRLSTVRSLLTAELSGIYILSTTILLLANLPHALSDSLVSALGYPDLEGKLIEKLFDKVFALSCVTTCVGIFISESFQRFYEDDDDIYDEELMLETKILKDI
ncbi:unnamed protein product [Kuraishia capsulata CBS 1993]|uniref:Golgi pH regulator conserved domain-containing protein n=1 Tax=Kuraishia capsulata CBS 1993 TaxID=1382522 RepID=W6MIX5_9ASCO|nr:uncharacterized protein KUCA_T00000308001 [Kuraishia capsulata CBS 1993]CDK24347.1 unnamed protein product [Kuraishia capsulata CBS 1993]